MLARWSKTLRSGEIVELRCTYDPATRGGDAPDGRKVKATLHWVSADTAVNVQVRIYDRLFDRPDPDNTEEGQSFKDFLHPQSIEVLDSCKVEAILARIEPGSYYQFERLGYFCSDSKLSTPGHPVFNRIVPLKDTWARMEKAAAK